MTNYIYAYLIGLGVIFTVTFIIDQIANSRANDKNRKERFHQIYLTEFQIWSTLYLIYAVDTLLVKRFPVTSQLFYAEIHLYGIILFLFMTILMSKLYNRTQIILFSKSHSEICDGLTIWTLAFPLLQAVKYISYYLFGQDFTTTYTIGILITVELAIFFNFWDYFWDDFKWTFIKSRQPSETYIPEGLTIISIFTAVLWVIGYPILSILNYFNLLTKYSTNLNNPTLLHFLIITLICIGLLNRIYRLFRIRKRLLKKYVPPPPIQSVGGHGFQDDMGPEVMDDD